MADPIRIGGASDDGINEWSIELDPAKYETTDAVKKTLAKAQDWGGVHVTTPSEVDVLEEWLEALRLWEITVYDAAGVPFALLVNGRRDGDHIVFETPKGAEMWLCNPTE